MQEAEELLTQIGRKFAIVKAEHIRFVKTSQKLKHVQAQMRSLEMFGERKPLVDYEQLVEDNQKLKERIEERDDMIGVLKVKAIRELQEAAHMKDMMHGTEEDIDALVRKLVTVDDRLEWVRASGQSSPRGGQSNGLRLFTVA